MEVDAQCRRTAWGESQRVLRTSPDHKIGTFSFLFGWWISKKQVDRRCLRRALGGGRRSGFKPDRTIGRRAASQPHNHVIHLATFQSKGDPKRIVAKRFGTANEPFAGGRLPIG